MKPPTLKRTPDSVFRSRDPEDLALRPNRPFRRIGDHTVSLTRAEHFLLNPPDAPDTFSPGSDTQLFRDDPHTISEVLEHWQDYQGPPEETPLEFNRREFLSRLSSDLMYYSSLCDKGMEEEARHIKNSLAIMIQAAQATGQVDTDPALHQTIEEALRTLAA